MNYKNVLTPNEYKNFFKINLKNYNLTGIPFLP